MWHRTFSQKFLSYAMKETLVLIFAILCYSKVVHGNLRKNLWDINFCRDHYIKIIAARSFRLCPKNTPDISGCVKQSIELLRPNIKTGNFGDGFVVQGIDPLKLDNVYTRISTLNANVTNIIASGVGNFIIEKIKVDFNNPYVDMTLNVPNIQATGQYGLKMSLGLLNINARGRGKFGTSVKLRCGCKGVVEIRNGQKYIKVKQCIATAKVTQLKMFFENVLPEKALNDAVNAFMNENTAIFIPDVEKAIQSTICELIKLNSNFLKIFQFCIYSLLL